MLIQEFIRKITNTYNTSTSSFSYKFVNGLIQTMNQLAWTGSLQKPGRFEYVSLLF